MSTLASLPKYLTCPVCANQALTVIIESGVPFPSCSAHCAKRNTALDSPAAPTVTLVWYTTVLNRASLCRRRSVTGCRCFRQSEIHTDTAERQFTGGPYTNGKPAVGPGLQSPSIS